MDRLALRFGERVTFRYVGPVPPTISSRCAPTGWCGADMLAALLGFPISLPLLGMGWLARQVAEAAWQEMLDPVRIEAALLTLERRLEAGEIDEATYEAGETELLEALARMRATMSAIPAEPPE